MKTRLIDLDTDYADVAKWWESHGIKVIPSGFLPKVGVMVESDEGVKLCAGWIYMDNSSPVCWFEWVTTNPKNRPTLSLVALKVAIGAAKAAVLGIREEATGAAAIMFTCRQPSLARLFEKEGFERTDEGVTHMLCVVENKEPVEAAN